MIRVNNRKVISNISRKSLKANKFRNIIAVFAIVLTSVLFTSVFTIGGGMLKTIEQSTCRQVGTHAHAGYKFITQEQYNNIKNHPLVKDISYNIVLGMADNPKLTKLRTEIRYSEDKNAKWGYNYPSIGNMPLEYKEIATSTLVLDALGIEHKIGSIVPLDFSVRGKNYHEEFMLAGFWKGDKISPAQQVWLSKDFVLDTVPLNSVPIYERDDEDISGTISCELWFDNSWNIEDKITQVTVDSGYNPNLISQGTNWAYGGAEVDFTSILLVVMVLLLITASGYLIIFNVFYISIAKDTRYYGLLKTIGTTGKQLKAIVRKQTLLLSAVGIPIGIALGYLLGVVLTPIIINNSYYVGQTALSINPIIFVLSAVFSLLTIFISCNKPSKLASKVSPMEAISYNEVKKIKKNIRKTKKVSIFFMAVQNVFRSKKKVISVVLSLALSIILLNSVYTIVTGFDMDKYLEHQIISDFTVANGRLITRYELTYTNEESFGIIKKINGLTDIGAVYMSENLHMFSNKALKNTQRIIDERLNIDYSPTYTQETIKMVSEDGCCCAHIYGLDKIIFDKVNFYDSEKNYDKFMSGNYIYVSPYLVNENGYEYPYYVEGDKVIIDYGDGDRKEYTVLGIATIPRSASCMHGHQIDVDFLLPTQEYLKHNKEVTPLHVLFNVDDSKEKEVEEIVSSYCENSEMTYISKATKIAQFKSEQNMFWIVGGVLAIILCLIGVLNFINSMLTSIIARRREFAILQSIGITIKQLKQMLIYEGLVYMGITIAAVFTIGNLIVWLLVKLIAGQIWFFSYRVTFLPMLICIPILVLLAYLIPVLSYKNVKKQSVVERLRETE